MTASLRRLTHGPASDFRSSWFPDGKRLAFVSTRDGNREIYVMQADGTHARRLTTHPGEDVDPRIYRSAVDTGYWLSVRCIEDSGEGTAVPAH